MNYSAILTFLVMACLGLPALLWPAGLGLPLSLLMIGVTSLACFVHYIIHHRLYEEMLGSVALGFVVILIGFIPFIGWLVLIGFILYNISKALEGLQALLPHALVGALFYGMLLGRQALPVHDDGATFTLAAVYLAGCGIFARTVRELPLRDALFRMSVVWLAIPFCVLTVISIMASLANIFRTVGSTITRTVMVPQNVSAHIRSGIQVEGYTRSVSTTVTEQVTRVVPGTGAVSAAVANQTAKSLTGRGEGGG
ncbi:hypothetical protein [Pseudomonas xanthosomatis]|uniref:hypothetical protein n=1 Tax=Pseudomonas xanthosomatis TaxID=2842356 RepID=UPI0035153DB5